MFINQIKSKLYLVHLLGGGEVFAGLETPFFLHFDLLHQVLSDSSFKLMLTDSKLIDIMMRCFLLQDEICIMLN